MLKHRFAPAVSPQGKGDVVSEQKLLLSSASPPYDNMGVNSATEEGGTSGFHVQDVARGGEPEDYFYKLALDTLQVAVKGYWRHRDGAVQLLSLRRSAESYSSLGVGRAVHVAPDGRELKVFPHGGRPSYQVLMRDGDGLEVRALPKVTMPSFIFRFGARWCVEQSIDELGRWMIGFVCATGFVPEKLQLSEVHVRCDTPVPFVESDMKKVRGAGTRNGSFNAHMYGGRLSGIDNLGGKKVIKFCIYDKRLEQKQKQAVLWPCVWESYGISKDTPIWRIEARIKRKPLKTLGLDSLPDLNERTIRGIWHRFTTLYLQFVSDPNKRTSRTSPLPKWAKVQACGEIMTPQPLSAQVQVTATQLIKQATGCLARAMAVAGIGHAQSEVESLIEEVVSRSEKRFEKDRKQYIWQMLRQAVEQYPSDAFASVSAVKGEIQQHIKNAQQRKLAAQPYSIQNLSVQGGTQ